MPTTSGNSHNFKVISLYTGAGGLDLGFDAAGFDTRVAVEMDDDCVTTLRTNRSWSVIHRSIHDVSSSELLLRAGLEPGEADMLIGAPRASRSQNAATGRPATRDAWKTREPRQSKPICVCCAIPSRAPS